MAELGDKIRAIRQRKQWTLKDLGKQTGLSVPYLSDIERRRVVNPTLETLKVIAAALECSTSELIEEGDETGSSELPLPISLQRFVRSEDFALRLGKLASRAGREPEEMEREVINFLATAPKRAASNLGSGDWRRLLTFYETIIEE